MDLYPLIDFKVKAPRRIYRRDQVVDDAVVKFRRGRRVIVIRAMHTPKVALERLSRTFERQLIDSHGLLREHLAHLRNCIAILRIQK